MIVGVVTFWNYIFIDRTCVWLLNLGWWAFFLHRPVTLQWLCNDPSERPSTVKLFVDVINVIVCWLVVFGQSLMSSVTLLVTRWVFIVVIFLRNCWHFKFRPTIVHLSLRGSMCFHQLGWIMYFLHLTSLVKIYVLQAYELYCLFQLSWWDPAMSLQ